LGISTVSETEVNGKSFHEYVQGTTLHGSQCLNEDFSMIPTTYYHPKGPLGAVFKHVEGKRVAILGMGAGTCACLGNKDQIFDFYEIDPDVVYVATKSNLFSYIEDCPPESRVILGDARLNMGNAEDGQYDLIVVDTFSSDSIPTHMLTKEAFELYFKKLAPGGLIALNISNRYYDFQPMLAGMASAFNAKMYVNDFETDDEWENFITSSRWVVIGQSNKFNKFFKKRKSWRKTVPTKDVSVWTDDFSSVMTLLH
jgi:spermidine synthase